MLRQKLVEKFVAADGSVQYRLMGKAAQEALAYLKLAQFMVSSIALFDPLGKLSSGPEIDMERFLAALAKKIAASVLYTLISTLAMRNTHDAEVWLKSSFAQLGQRKQWAYFLMQRAAFEAEKEVTMKFGDLDSLGKILENVSEDMVEKLWISYRKLYPIEAKFFDDTMSRAIRYANVSRRLQKGELDKEKIDKMPFHEVLERYG